MTNGSCRDLLRWNCPAGKDRLQYWVLCPSRFDYASKRNRPECPSPAHVYIPGQLRSARTDRIATPFTRSPPLPFPQLVVLTTRDDRAVQSVSLCQRDQRTAVPSAVV